MAGGLLVGLGAALSGIGDTMTKNYERRQEEAAAERKAMLAMRLEEELWRRKTEYAKANPTYAKFISDPITGAITAFDEFGGSKEVKAGSPELAAQNRRMAEAELAAKLAPSLNAQVNAESHGLLDPLRAAQIKASTAAALASANYRNSQTGDKEKKPPFTPAQLERAAIEAAERVHPEVFPTTNPYTKEIIPGDPEAAEAAIEAQRQALIKRYAQGILTAPPVEDNPYDALIDQQDDSSFLDY